MEPINVSRLRFELPAFDTPLLEQEWLKAYQKLEAVGELGVWRAMSVGTRRILFQVLRAMNARSVLDIGTYVGTSAACFALAVAPSGGRVVTVDVREANAPDGFWKIDGRPHSPQELMEKLKVEKVVQFCTTSGIQYLEATSMEFDFVCLDAGKGEEEDYRTILLALDKLNPNGLIFLDDVFPNGKPMMPSGFSEPGPWLALERLKREAPIDVHQFNKTLEGADIRCAFITRKRDE